ncbi:MAG: hypothetical protein EZS28_013901 [Streblomastix strix]|uniref:Tyr recombinase domain-containing protein n=1 Tax=Streblomastix strix TaxID=222440 RepID=A0A5J4W858_9EUKA|nr:MAG: hypothetical protein EZS28_013901 [Streblomastix strix]
MSVCFFRPNEIAEIRLKFSNVDKTENQASLRLAPKQAKAIETYEVYETDNESLSPKLAIYEWIDRLKKQFPKGTDFLLWHKGFNKLTTTKDFSLQLTKLLRELKIIGASAYSIRYSATTELAKLGIPERDLATLHITPKTHVQFNNTISSHPQQEQTKQLGNQQIIKAMIMKDQTRFLNKEVRQGEKGVTNFYPRLPRRQGNDLLSPYLLISPLTHLKICIPTRGEIEIRREFTRKLKDRTSGMMLMVSWSAQNDNAEIRTLPCQSLIQLIQRIIDKEMMSTSCIDKYKEQIHR